MELKTWLNQERGRATALAAFLNLSVGRISQIADGGVPKKYMRQVRDFTGNAVTLECMVNQALASTAPEAASVPPITPTTQEIANG